MGKNPIDDKDLNLELEKLQDSHGAPDLSFQVPLKIPPKYGAYLWWPGKVEDWVHLDDYEIANELIPSNRIFRRDELDEEYAIISYGTYSLRVRPVIWLEVQTDGYEIGDQVEVKSRMGQGRPFMATLADLRWDREHNRILYRLEHNDRKLRRPYTVDEFQLAMSLDAHLDARKLKLMEKTKRQ